MDLQGWETYADGTAINGATVEAYLSSGTNLVPPGAVVSSTTTNAQGYWTLPGLADANHDIKISISGQVRWYKGESIWRTKMIIGDNFTPIPANLIHNSGFELWRNGTSFSVAASSTAAYVADSWLVDTVAGDSAVITQETTTISSASSRRSLKAVYTKTGAGPLYIYQELAGPLVYELRGKVMYLSMQIRQGVSSNVRVYIHDNAGTTFSSASATTGSFVTLSCTRTIDSSSTGITVAIEISAADTVYADNAILAISSVLPTYIPHYATAGDVRVVDLNTHALPLTATQLFMGAV